MNAPEIASRMDASAPVLLRPLGVGEIIDRALTLYIKNFVVFTATLLVVVFIPFAAGEYFVLDANSGTFAAMGDVLRHLGSTPAVPQPPPLGTRSFVEFGIGYLLIFVGFLLSLFANSAVAVNVAAIYSGRRPSVGYGLRTAFAHAGALIALLFLVLLVAIGVYSVLALVAMGIVLGAAGIATIAPGVLRSPLAAIGLILLLILALLALFLAACLLVLAFAFACYAIVIENESSVAAMASGFRRVFNRREWGKAFVVVLVALVLGFGMSLLSSFVEVLLFTIPGTAAFVAVWIAFFNLIATAVQTVFYAVYYYDVRIRREGFDLETALARLSAPTA